MKKLIYILLVGLSTSVFAQHPINLQATNLTNTSADLSWDASLCSATINLKYREVTSPASAWSANILGVTSPHTLTGLTASTTYQWTVKCFGTSGWSAAETFTTLNCQTTSTDTQVACDSLVWINGVTYHTTSTNAATDTLLAVDGCDSVVTLNLTINNSSVATSSSITACDSYTWEGQTTTVSIDLVHTYVAGNAAGCDSTHTLSVTIEFGGCTDPIAANYDPLATCDDGSCIACTKTITQGVNGFSPNPIYAPNAPSNDTLSISNTSNCDINIRPEFIISLNSGSISQGDIILQYKNPNFAGYIPLPYDIDNNGNAYGFWNYPPTTPLGSPLDSTGYNLAQSAAESLAIKVKFSASANYGEYTAIWSIKEVDALGDIMNTLADNDTTTLAFVDCNLFLPYISYSDITCWNDNNGSASIDSIANGSGDYSYSWVNTISPGSVLATSNTITGLSAGEYSYTIIDDNWTNCSYNETFTIIEPNDFTIDSSQTNVSCYGVNDGTVTVNITGATPTYTYVWDANSSETTNTVTGLSGGTHTCTITDVNSCDTTVTFIITEPQELTSSYTKTNVSCWGENNGSAIVNFFGGTIGSNPGDTNYILGWDSLLYYLTYPLTEFTTPVGVPAGIYPYSVTDLNGCTIYDTITITQPDSLYTAYTTGYYNGFEISCYGYNNGEIDIQVNGGMPPFQNYLDGILQSNLISNNLFAGTYTDSIVDGNGCIATNTIILTEPTELISTLTPFNVSCNGLCDGEITSSISGGISPYYYQWPDGTTIANASNLCAMNWWSLSVTDVNGCVANSSTTISEPSAISVSVDSTANITTYAGNDGYVYISSTGGSGLLSTNWTSIDGFTSTIEDIVNVSASTYFLEITDTNSCLYSDTFELTHPSSLSLTIDSVINTNCYDSCNGSINITANGGDSIYTYLWGGPNGFTSTIEDIYNLCYGEYIITVDDGDTALIDTINIYQPQPITTFLSANPILCYNGMTQAEINVWGGTQPFTYNWSNGGNNYITTVSSGTHLINVIDMNGCSLDTSITLLNPDSISTQTTSTNTDCFGGNNGSVSINITNGGTSPYNFSNDNGVTYQIFNTFNNLFSGNYFFLISDDNGCLGSAASQVIEPSEITSTTTAIHASCYEECDGSVNATALGGTSPYSYVWDNGDSTQTTIGLCAGFYNVIITDTNGCINTNSVIINEPNPLLINIWIDGNNIVATSGFSSYQWYDNNDTPISGDTNSIFTPAGTGVYYVSVSDTNGCTANSYVIEYNISSIENYSLTTKIFPNPTNGNITIRSEYAIKSISVYNSIGNQLLAVNKNENNNPETKLDLSTFAKGVYCIKISINNQIINQRIILQ